MVEIYDAVPPSRVEVWTRGRIIFLSVSGVLALGLFIAVREVLLPFFLAVIIAYVLTPAVAWGENRLRLPRSVSIISVYLVVVAAISLSIAAMAPRLYDETAHFAREVPSLVREVAHREGTRVEGWVRAYQGSKLTSTAAESHPKPALLIEKNGEGYSVELGSGVTIVQESKSSWRVSPRTAPSPADFRLSKLIDDGTLRLIEYAQLNVLEFIKFGQAVVIGFSRSILLMFMTLMMAGYLMHTRESVLGFFRSLAPRVYRPGFDFLMLRVDRGLSGVVRGQLLICLVNGLLSAIGFAFFGLKYWPVLALVAGVMSIIPIFGSILSTIPAVLIGLTQDFWIAFWVLIWILGIHQVEANLLNPKIIGVSAKIHPVLVVFSLLVGEHYFGLWGALLAVPALSITQSVFNHFRYGLPDVEADSLRPTA